MVEALRKSEARSGVIRYAIPLQNSGKFSSPYSVADADEKLSRCLGVVLDPTL
jgi:hypothetical protein